MDVTVFTVKIKSEECVQVRGVNLHLGVMERIWYNISRNF